MSNTFKVSAYRLLRTTAILQQGGAANCIYFYACKVQRPVCSYDQLVKRAVYEACTCRRCGRFAAVGSHKKEGSTETTVIR